MKVVVDLLAKQPFDFRPLALDEDEYGPAGEPRFSYVVERSARLTPRDLLEELLKYQKIADQAGVRFTGITASSYQ